MEQKISILALAAMIQAIVSLLGFFLSPLLAVIIAFSAITCGVIALVKIKKSPEIKGKWMAISGIATGTATIFLWITFIILFLHFMPT